MISLLRECGCMVWRVGLMLAQGGFLWRVGGFGDE